MTRKTAQTGLTLKPDQQYPTGLKHGQQGYFMPRYRVYPEYCRGYREGLKLRSTCSVFNPGGKTNGFAWNLTD